MRVFANKNAIPFFKDYVILVPDSDLMRLESFLMKLLIALYFMHSIHVH